MVVIQFVVKRKMTIQFQILSILKSEETSWANFLTPKHSDNCRKVGDNGDSMARHLVEVVVTATSRPNFDGHSEHRELS